MRPKAIGTYVDLNNQPGREPQRVSGINWDESMFVPRGDQGITHDKPNDQRQQRGNGQ